MRTLAGASVLLAAGLLLECTARASLFGAAGLHPARIDSVRPIFQTDILEASADPDVGYRFRPNLDLWFKLVHLRTNSQGLRYPEVSPEKPQGVVRVAVMGSSFTLPSGVELEESYHSQLERRFDPGGSGRVQFLNFSVGAFHPSQNVALLETTAMAYEPDLVLFGLTRMGAGAALGRKPARIIRPGERVHPFFESFLWKLLLVRSGRPPPAPAIRFDEPAPGQVVPTVIERLAEFARATGIPVVLVRLEFEDPSPNVSDIQVRDSARALGLHHVDTRGPFSGLDTRQFWVHPLDPHPDARAHRMFADVIGAYLTSAGLLEPTGR